MRQFYYIIQTLRHAVGSNLFKVVSLGLALAMSILLFTRVAYEQSFDTCFRDYDNLYQVWSQHTMKGETFLRDQNYYPVAGAIQENFPEQVEVVTSIMHGGTVMDPLYYGDTRFNESKIMADPLFFRTMGIDVLKGNPQADLRQPNVVYLSESFARRMFGGEDPIGKVVSYNHEYDLTVRGIYADIPDNATVNPAAVISLSSTWIASSWDRADLYPQYVRLRPGADPEAINSRLEAMVKKYRPDGNYTVRIAPIRDTYRGYEDVRRMKSILLVMGLAILFIAALNYALLSISSLSRRAKAVGVHKCSGASGAGIFGMFLLETAFIIALAIAVMVFLLYSFRDFVEDTAATRLGNLFHWSRLWVPALTVGLLFVVGGVIPGHIFARIPVTQVFRRYTEGKKGWKRMLLFVQFTGVAFLCGIMAMVMAQYGYVMNKNMGYNPERIATTDVSFDKDEGRNALQFFRGLPYVEAVSCTTYGTPVGGYSGTMIHDDVGNSLFSSRFDRVPLDYLSFMGMTLIEGREPRQRYEMVVNETFVRLMQWKSNTDALGRMVDIGMGEEQSEKVVGVIRDFDIKGCLGEPMPYLAAYRDGVGRYLLFRLKEPFGDNLLKLQKAAAEAFPSKTIDIYSMEAQLEALYNDVRIMRNATTVAGIVMFVIMLMGLWGYTADEVQRRSKEIAIRKVNGAEASGILELLGRDILMVAAPSVALGILAAVYVNSMWMDMFADRIEVSWPLYVLTALALLALIVGCVLWRTWGIANANPVESIKSE